MLKAERLQRIIEQIAKDNKVELDELSKSLNVSTDTVRRDIKELSDKGLLKAVRGGAINNLVMVPHATERQNINRIFAEKTLEYIRPGQVVFIDAGSATLSVISALSREISLTVITNNFLIAIMLEEYPNIDVIFLGGQLNKRSFSTGGNQAIETIRNFRPDVCLLGACSIDLKSGITCTDYEQALVKKALTEVSKFVVVLSAYDKVGHSDPYYICPSGKINVFVTEQDPSEAELANFKTAGLQIR